MLIEAAMRFYLITIQMAEQVTTKGGDDLGERQLQHCWEYGNLCDLHRNQCGSFSKNLQRRLSYNPAVSLLGTYLEDSKSAYHRDACSFIFTATLFITTRKLSQRRHSSSEEGSKCDMCT